jgi:dTDP-4-amino-4,6-dideoxygalactose transaminase
MRMIRDHGSRYKYEHEVNGSRYKYEHEVIGLNSRLDTAAQQERVVSVLMSAL